MFLIDILEICFLRFKRKRHLYRGCNGKVLGPAKRRKAGTSSTRELSGYGTVKGLKCHKNSRNEDDYGSIIDPVYDRTMGVNLPQRRCGNGWDDCAIDIGASHQTV
jgi:hypothetical protein